VIIGKMTFEFPIRVRTSLLVGVALLIATCSRPGSTAGSSALKPIDQAALQTMVDTTAKELLIPGAAVLLRTPQGEFTVTYGTTLLGAIRPPRADTHFRIASNTKTMTAAVIVLLAQEGKLSLDDPVSKYVPGVPSGDKITITELLKMRSGFYSYDDDPEFWAILDRDPTKVWSPAEVLAITFKHPLDFPPGTGFHYSNANYALLGLIAEKVDGRPLASCFQDRLFGPLRLKHTVLPASTSNTLPDPYSHGYLYGGCSFSNLVDKPYPPDLQAAARAGTLKPDDCTGQNPSYASAAGGVISTANDLATWIQALVGGKVLNADYQRQWLDSVQLEDPSKPNGLQYGYGITQLRWGANTLYFHGGEMPGFNSFMGYDPASKMTLVVWTNLTVSLDGKVTANALMLKVLDQIYLVSPLPPSPSPTNRAKPVGVGAVSQRLIPTGEQFGLLTRVAVTARRLRIQVSGRTVWIDQTRR
jgi:D-alanyl-D-alanine carboxypeptidase